MEKLQKHSGDTWDTIHRSIPYKNYFYNKFISLSSLTVCSTGIEQSAPGFVHGPEVRSYYTFHYCITGKGVLKMNGGTFPVQEGDLFLIYPSMKVYPIADEESPWELTFIGFTGNDARLLTDACGFSPSSPVQNIPEKKTTHRMILDIYEHRGDRPAEIVSMTARLYALMSHLMSTTQQRFPHTPGQQYIGPACDYIDDHFQEHISVDDIADAIGISRSSLYRAFMTTMAISPIDYLNEHRVKVSANLLLQKDLTLKEISFACGFSNPLYYSTVFKKFMGMSPTDYRRHQMRKQHSPSSGPS